MKDETATRQRSTDGSDSGASRERFPFPPAYRLRKRSEFTFLQSNGRKVYSPHFLLFFLASSLTHSRIGITVSRKVDVRAARRNRVKRMLREIFRVNTAQLARPTDLLIIARSEAAELSFAEVEDEVYALLRRAKLIEPAERRG